MKILNHILLAFLIIPFVDGLAQLPTNKISKEEYIALYQDIAIEEMNSFGIPASITLAQGILESGSGNSRLATKAKNHFGIKCHKGWKGKTFHMDDDSENECFRKYDDPYVSYKDHSEFLSTRDRYAFLFDLDITDYKGWAKGLKKAGYATNPKYPQLLIKIIEDHELYKLDKLYNTDLAHRYKPRIGSKEEDNINHDDFEPINLGAANRKMYINNGVKFIYARQGDDYFKIAQDFDIYTYQIRTYNDMKKKDVIKEGQIIYLEAKKNKGSSKFHTVQPGETLWGISQINAVKLKKICKYNELSKKATVYPDQKIILR